MRHVTFAQVVRWHPGVWRRRHCPHRLDGRDRAGHVERRPRRRARAHAETVVAAEAAASMAAGDVDPTTVFVPVRVGHGDAARGRPLRARSVPAAMSRRPSCGSPWTAACGSPGTSSSSPTACPSSTTCSSTPQTGELLLRRNRVLDANGTGRVLQSAATEALDPRRPDQMPAGGAACPPPANHELRDLATPFRDAVDRPRRTPAGCRATTSTSSAATPRPRARPARSTAHAGCSTSRSTPPGRPKRRSSSRSTSRTTSSTTSASTRPRATSRSTTSAAAGSAATRSPASRAPPAATTRRSSPRRRARARSSACSCGTARDCWSEDVDGDGVEDIDGDFDTDIILHEFHHGVSHRLNTAFTGNEANAIGEGGSDFFAYSINGDTALAEYARPGRTADGQRQDLQRLVLPARASSASRTTTARSGPTCCGTSASASGPISSAAATPPPSTKSHQLYIDGLEAVAALADHARPQGRDARRPTPSGIPARLRASTSARSGNRSRRGAWASTRPTLPTTASIRSARTSRFRRAARPRRHRPR